MKVKELIEQLSKFPDDMEVKIQQLIPVTIYRVYESNVDIYKDGEKIGKKKAIIIT